MLVNLKEVLNTAGLNSFAVGAFNTPNLECINAVIHAAEKYNVPVIMSHAELHESVSPLNEIGPVMVQAAVKSAVPVCVHLDHCETLEYMQAALKLGFTGVMFDGSNLEYGENVRLTKKAVKMAAKYSASVEAELGRLASREGGFEEMAEGPVYTDPELAAEFVAETSIDALAPSFGTSHGIYKLEPILDIERVAQISRLVKIPLVMHGGSGVSEKNYKMVIQNGIRKINYYSYMSKAGVEAVRELISKQEVTYFHDVALAAEQAMQKNVEKAMSVFYCT